MEKGSGLTFSVQTTLAAVSRQGDHSWCQAITAQRRDGGTGGGSRDIEKKQLDSELTLKENPGRWTLGPLERCKQGGPRLFLLTHLLSLLSGWAGRLT